MTNLADNVSEWLLDNQSFQKIFEKLVVASVVSQFGDSFLANDNAATDLDWGYLLFCASILAASNNSNANEAALRIAQYALQMPGLGKSQKDSAAIILKNLSNQLSLSLAQSRNLIHPELVSRLPITTLLDWTKNDLEQSISENRKIKTNRFQKTFWDALSQYDWVSVSAPTSGGKSFILKEWILHCIQSKKYSSVVYIVPTRALIAEVERDLRRLFSNLGCDVNITSVPSHQSHDKTRPNVSIYTQERLQLLMNDERGNLPVDLLVIDEAQKVGDFGRGILLQQVIERIAQRSPKVQIIFCSPLTENPEILLTDARNDIKTIPIISEESTVNQNLIWLTQKPRDTKKWSVTLINDGKKSEIGELRISNRPTDLTKRLTFLAYEIGKKTGGNVIYVNRAADAETVAEVLYDCSAGNEKKSVQEISDLIDLVKKQIHPQYVLAKTLQRGIAFHYGNMPEVVRTEIERLFTENKIDFLVCTSTLIEGVNTSCKNIFMRNPQKGNGNPMSIEDFWNLAGRAGRWGKEFQGNIFCVEPQKWDNHEITLSRTRFKIERSTDSVLQDLSRVTNFIISGAQITDDDSRVLEKVFSYLSAQHIQYGSLFNSPWANRFLKDMAKFTELNLAIDKANKSLKFPLHVIERNPGISPLSMNAMYEFFESEVGAERIEQYLPPDPSDLDAVEHYSELFLLIRKHLNSPVLGFNTGASIRAAIVVTNWMTGSPLSMLIKKRERYDRKHSEIIDINKIIRDVMGDVEKIARFEAPKYLACYCDVLTAYLNFIDRADLRDRILNYALFLEFGASSTTQISLISLGLSRTAAIEIFSLWAEDELGQDECLARLIQREWETSTVSPIIKREIDNLLHSLQPRAKLVQ